MHSGTFSACVIGYHVSGSISVPLAKVTFYLDNGPGVTVNSPNYTHYGAPEYCVHASDALMNDGQHEFRAIAYPVQGYPRVMQSSATVTETAGSANLSHIAHGQVNGKALVVSGSSDPNFANGATYYIIPTGLTQSAYELSATQGGGAITAGANGTFTITYLNAGLNEAQPTHGESLFIFTNHLGSATPTIAGVNHAVAYADSVNGR